MTRQRLPCCWAGLRPNGSVDAHMHDLCLTECMSDALCDSTPDCDSVCRLDVLREAAGQYQELNYITMKYKKWMLQQVRTCLWF